MDKKDFNKDLNFGNIGENLFLEGRFPEIIFGTGSIIKLTNNFDQCHKGDIQLNNGSVFNVEIKTRKPSYSNFAGQDILIEINHSNNGSSWDGWIDKYEKDTILINQWTEYYHGEIRLMSPIVSFKPSDLKDHRVWLESHKIKSSINNGYDTNFVIIKVNELKEKIPVEITAWTQSE